MQRHQVRDALVRGRRHLRELAREADRAQQLSGSRAIRRRRRASRSRCDRPPRAREARGTRRAGAPVSRVGLVHHRFGHGDQQRGLAREVLSRPSRTGTPARSAMPSIVISATGRASSSRRAASRMRSTRSRARACFGMRRRGLLGSGRSQVGCSSDRKSRGRSAMVAGRSARSGYRRLIRASASRI